MPDFRGRLSAQAQLDGRVRQLETKQVISEPQTANFSARGNSSYIIEAPASNAMVVVLPPSVPSNRNEEIVFMHRNARTVRYVALDGLVNKTASANVSGIGQVRFVSDGETGWYSQSSGGSVSGGNAITVVGSTVRYTGSLSGLTLTGSTGNLGTVNISTLAAGGTLFISAPVADWQIEGFSGNNTNGFSFSILVGASAFIGTLFDEDATASASNRLRCQNATDVVGTRIQAIVTYHGNGGTNVANRWSVVSQPTVTSAGGLTHPQVLARICFRA